MNSPLEMKPKRVVFPIAGKGGVGKTTVVSALAEWYASNNQKADLLDMDPENKAEGSLKALFTNAHKLPALESWTYDKLLGISLDSDADVILADVGAAQGYQMIPWFRDFYKVMQESGLALRWTALGIVDGDIASARSVLEWGQELQDAVDYVIVHNYFQEGVPSAWENPKLEPAVRAFRQAFSPTEIRFDARRPDLQRMMRTMNVTLTLVGIYNSHVGYGQNALQAVWRRVIFPDGSALSLGGFEGDDSEGTAGFRDQVNNHWVRIFSGALLTSLFAAGIEISQGQNSSVLTQPSYGQQIGQAVGQQVGQVGVEVTRRNLNIQPTIVVRPGYRFFVRVEKDLLLCSVLRYASQGMTGHNL
jgi:hypothetical protein